MINVSISESHVSLDRYLSCYTSVEQMAIQIRHSTDVSFQRLGKFNLTVHVNKKFTEHWGQGCGLQVERVIASNVTQGPAIQKLWRRGLPKPSRENTNTDCYGSPSEPSAGKAEKEKMGFEPCHQERLSMVIGKEKKKKVRWPCQIF